MKKTTKLNIQWLYNIIKEGESDFIDFKEQLSDKQIFGKPLKSFTRNYSELAKDVVAFANKKGGFIIIGITDKEKEVNKEFRCNNEKIIFLIKQIQDQTKPSITLIPHKIKVNETELLVLEIPFSEQLHCTSKGLYVIRNIDGNKIIEPHEMASIQSEKNLIIYDQKIWNLQLKSKNKDKQGNLIPAWQDIDKLRQLYQQIKQAKPKSPYLKTTLFEFSETLGIVKEVQNKYLPTTTGLLFVATKKALKEIPSAHIKYIRYKSDGSYTPYEFKGNIIEIIDKCFAQLKSEINLQEFQFGLYREYVEDYQEIVMRELIVNAVVHRDYSRLQSIQIRKYENYIEFESPGAFPQGITTENYLRKSNARNPSIMDILREIGYAEKAGSGFDKIFTALLTKGKQLPEIEEVDSSLLVRIFSGTVSETLLKLGKDYKELYKKDLELDKVIVLNEIVRAGKIKQKELEQKIFVNINRLKVVLTELQDINFIQKTGRTKDTQYIIHKSRLIGLAAEKEYLSLKKQEKFNQKETIMRYLDEFKEINNSQVREILRLPDKDTSYVSRLLSEMLNKNLITIARVEGHNQRFYKRKK